MRCRLTEHRHNGGQVCVDLPIVLTLLFLLLFVPALNLTSASVRAYFIRTACLEAVHRAASAETFLADVPASSMDVGSLSANHAAIDSLNQFISTGYVGSSQITIAPYANIPSYPTPILRVVREGIDGSETIYTGAVPAGDIDDSKYTYYFELQAEATAQPLLPYRGPWFANMPGLTGPMPLKISCRQMVENASGLVY